MVLDWTSEEKTLVNIKKIIAAVWRMNSRQMKSYCQKLQKNQSKILPGRLGSTFFELLRQVSEADTSAAAKFWPVLMQDTEHLLNFIQVHKNKDQKAWLTALSRLETEQDKYFKTQLGKAFILLLQEKTGIKQKDKNKDQSKEYVIFIHKV